MEFNFFDFEPSPESSIIHPYYQFINGDQTVSSINNPTADRRFPDSVALGSSDKPPGNELQLHPRLAEGVEQLHRTREAKPKRTRRDHKPRLIPSNRFGRAGCLRCHHCRKWRQKCVYESLEQPCKLCQSRGLPCSLGEKVLGPKTQSMSQDPQWIENRRDQIVLSLNGGEMVSPSDWQDQYPARSASNRSQSSGIHRSPFNSISPSLTQIDTHFPPSSKFKRCPTSLSLAPESITQGSVWKVFPTSSLTSSPPFPRATHQYTAEITDPVSTVFRSPSSSHYTVLPHPPSGHLSRLAPGAMPSHSPSMTNQDGGLVQSSQSSSTVYNFTLLETSYIRFIESIVLGVLPIPLSSAYAANVIPTTTLPFSLDALPSNAIPFGVLAYECTLKDKDGSSSLQYLKRCVDCLPPSDCPVHSISTENAYARWLVIEVHFELGFDADGCHYNIHKFSILLNSLRQVPGVLTDWELLWMDNSELYFYRRLWNHFVADIFTSSSIDTPNSVAKLKRLQESFPTIRTFGRRSTVSWQELGRMHLSMRCCFMFCLLETMNTTTESRHHANDETQKVAEALYEVVAQVGHHLQSRGIELIDTRSPYESTHSFNHPIAESMNGKLMLLGHDKELFGALSLYYIANLISETFKSFQSRPPTFPTATTCATPLCRIVSTRNDESFYRENIRDLFLAGLFIPKVPYFREKSWIMTRLGMLVHRSQFRLGTPDPLMMSVIHYLMDFIELSEKCSSVGEIWRLRHENGLPLWKCILILLKFGD